MQDSDDFDPDEFEPFLPGQSPREPDETDHSLEPILVEIAKVTAFQIRDTVPVTPIIVSVDVGYRMDGDPTHMERHMRIQLDVGDDFEEKYMKYAAERLISDARNIIEKGLNEDNTDPK